MGKLRQWDTGETQRVPRHSAPSLPSALHHEARYPRAVFQLTPVQLQIPCVCHLTALSPLGTPELACKAKGKGPGDTHSTVGGGDGVSFLRRKETCPVPPGPG